MSDDEDVRALVLNAIDHGFTEHLAKVVGTIVLDWKDNRSDEAAERFLIAMRNATHARALFRKVLADG